MGNSQIDYAILAVDIREDVFIIYPFNPNKNYELNENEDYKLPSKFDRVYLVADFDSKIVRVN